MQSYVYTKIYQHEALYDMIDGVLVKVMIYELKKEEGHIVLRSDVRARLQYSGELRRFIKLRIGVSIVVSKVQVAL